jgi:aspartate aminotransferase
MQRHIARFVLDTTGGERAKFMTTPAPPGLVRLDSGSPSFPTPPHIVAAVKQALDEGRTHYILEKGDFVLMEALCETIAAETGAAYEPAQILITNGSSSGIYAVMASFVDPHDEVIVFDPSYSVYAHIAKLLGAVAVPVPHDAHYQLDIEAVRRAITPRTRLVLLNNPNNPTGIVYRREALEALAGLCAERGLLLVADEAYSKIIQPGHAHVPMLSLQRYREHLILLGTFSKNHAMTGWRLGYVVAPRDLIDTVYGVHRTINGPICTFVQRAGVAALRGPQDWIADACRVYQRRGALAHRLARSIPGLHPADPQGAFYLWCRYDAAVPAREVRARLWARGVALRSGSEYGATGENHLRISYSVAEETIEQGMAIVDEVMRGLH